MVELKKNDVGLLHSDCMHICLIFDTDEQREKIVSEYLANGLKLGEKVRCGVDALTPGMVLSWLLELGVKLPEDMENGALSIFQAETYYNANGKFDPPELIKGIIPRYHQLIEAGYSGVRSTSEMSWALKCNVGADRLLEYEVLLNTVYPNNGMCQYDARLFNGVELFNVLKVHPYMVAQGQIVNNPFYIQPEEFLAKNILYKSGI
jgi:hypothetical protein